MVDDWPQETGAMIDVSRMLPEAQPIVAAAAAIYIRHTQPWFIGLLAHGSALKGGAIRGCSDIDLQLYLKDEAFIADGMLRLDIGMAIQRDLSKLDPAPFQYIQCYPLPPRLPKEYVGPIPGAYQIVAGTLPVADATSEILRASARQSLATLDTLPSYVFRTMLQHGGGKIERHARLLCTQVWPTLYQILALQHEDAVRVWGWPKEQAIDALPPQSEVSQTIRRFHRAVCTYYAEDRSVELALEVFGSGLAFLQAAKQWWEETGP